MDTVERLRLRQGQPHQASRPKGETGLLEVGQDESGLAGGDRVGLDDGESLHGLEFLVWVEERPGYLSRALRSGTTSAGRFMTLMPAASKAAIFSAAVPEEPEMMAPACPIRRPGGAVWPAMNPTTGLVT